MECIFCQIAQQKLATPLYYQDEQVVAFADLHPQAPTHMLIIPRQHIATLNEVSPADKALLGHLFYTAKVLAEKLAIATAGYRLVLNCNPDGGQAVFHIHLHLLGGRSLTWPPG